MNFSGFIEHQSPVVYMKFEGRSIVIYARRMIYYCIRANVTLIHMRDELLHFVIRACSEAEETYDDHVTGCAKQI